MDQIKKSIFRFYLMPNVIKCIATLSIILQWYARAFVTTHSYFIRKY